MQSLNFYSQFIEYIEPIPLTDELMLKAGFDTDKIMFWKEGICFGLYKSGIYYCPTGSIMLRGIKIKYVNQLQNLFFALTNQELEFK